MIHCPFCHAQNLALFRQHHAYAVLDLYPVSKGHTLIISEAHASDFFALSNAAQEGMLEAVRTARALLVMSYPDIAGWNVGVNVGEAGGQTIEHAHIHLIPRYDGDVEDPRGGVRWVIPKRAPYP
jgi:diadenosine tetraphosphate (Ap4A) HIT family hydrolase